MSNSPKKDPLDTLVGMVAGFTVGAPFALGYCLVADPTPFTMTGLGLVMISFVGAFFGYLNGEEFFRWIREQGTHWS